MNRSNFMELYKLIEEIEDQNVKRGQSTGLTKVDSQLVLHHPLLRELRLHCSHFAFANLLQQFMHSHAMKVINKFPKDFTKNN